MPCDGVDSRESVIYANSVNTLGIWRMTFRREPRFLRSNRRPSFTTKKRDEESELEKVIRRDVVTVAKTTPIRLCAQKMARSGYRRMPVTVEQRRLVGIVTATDIVNYLGGGEYYAIVQKRHGGNIFTALEEPVSSIMTRGVVKAYYEETREDVVSKMIKFNVGGMPVVVEDEVVGIVTERDLLRTVSDRIPDLLVRDVMTHDVVTVRIDETLLDLARRIIERGVRRLPVLSQNRVVGVVSSMDIVKYIASSEPFRHVVLGLVEEVMKARVADIASPSVITISPESRLSDAYRLMIERDVGMLVVSRSNELRGLITERDILLACFSR